MSGSWTVEDGEPFWVWLFANGWQEKVSAIQVAMDSTETHGRPIDLCIAHAQCKIQRIYSQLGLPEPNLVPIRPKLVAWCNLRVPQMQLNISNLQPKMLAT